MAPETAASQRPWTMSIADAAPTPKTAIAA
jgi:hypothetical protein